MITGNVIQRSWLHLGASNASFDNAGISSYVTVYNNTLVDTSADTGIWGWGSTYPVFQGITFFQNSFIGQGLRLGNAGGPWVVENYFEMRTPQDAKTNPVAVKLEETQNPSILGNVELTGQPGDFSLVAKSTQGLVTAAT